MSNVSMTAASLRNEVFAGNRAIGQIALAVAAGSGRSRPARLHESGSLRVRFPHRDGRVLDAVIVNTAGGMTGGDRFDLDIDVAAGAELSVTTAAAEKIYRTLGPETVLDVNLTVGAGGALAWLPQETILFDRARLRRKIDVDLAADASLLVAEASIFGRSAMGETVVSGCFFDCWRVRIGGALVYADSIRLDGGIAQSLTERAIAAGGAAVASVVKIPGNEDHVAAVRALQQDLIGEVGASAWNGLVAVRCVAGNGAALRSDLVSVLTVLGSGPLPRLWLN
ncbi:MAG: urease accessory protein UreD [Xanthobacteraceae bacterium]